MRRGRHLANWHGRRAQNRTVCVTWAVMRLVALQSVQSNIRVTTGHFARMYRDWRIRRVFFVGDTQVKQRWNNILRARRPRGPRGPRGPRRALRHAGADTATTTRDTEVIKPRDRLARPPARPRAAPRGHTREPTTAPRPGRGCPRPPSRSRSPRPPRPCPPRPTGSPREERRGARRWRRPRTKSSPRWP